jgi:hypothetical protein
MDSVEWISMMHKQNLNGRESEDEIFEAGISAGIEETEELTIEFVEWIKDNCAETPSGWQINGREYSSKNLYEIFKRERV